MAENEIKSTGTARGGMSARIIDEKEGLKVMEHVRAIRIHSRDYVLLIMQDYSPTLGQIDGDVIFLLPGEEVTYKGIKGCFKQQDNEFTMIVESDSV